MVENAPGIRTLIADDHPIVRSGIHAIVAGWPDFQIVGEANDGREAVELADRLMPDLAIVDPAMPQLNGADATRRMRELNPALRVVALSMHADECYICGMLSAGASSYLLKTCNSEELRHAIRVSLEGGIYLSPDVAPMVVEGYIHAGEPRGRDEPRLSAREREILQLIAEGYSAKQIGQMLHVSSRTIDSHRQRIMDKLSADSVATLTKRAIALGLTTVDC